ncbi:MAG: hypothetical protein U9R38_05520 [Candidatus Margulisiibacteriota bacterium]|nr:hypothetical protein [Candidatus Margulisiibacteriota bacterium]
MGVTALYQIGSRPGKAYCFLRRAPGRSITPPPGKHITEREFHRLHDTSPDIKFTNDGIKVGGRVVRSSHILVRTEDNNINNCTNQVFVSSAEMETLSARFKVPQNVLNGAFFELHPGSSPSDIYFRVRPIWSELLDPGWKADFLAWVAKNGEIPSPCEIEWSTYGKGRIAMPALFPLLHFGETKAGIIKGQLTFDEIGNARRAIFSHKHNREIRKVFFGLEPDKVNYLPEEASSAANGNGAPDWSIHQFKKLFGKNPSITEYTFAKNAGATGMPLGNIGGTNFVVKNSKGNGGFIFDQGEPYIIKVTRNGRSVRFEVYKESSMLEPLAKGHISLDNVAGFPIRDYISLLVDLIP